jgi:hypothetical protein
MERIPDPNLRAYIVWLPVLWFRAQESAARHEAGRIPDGRAVRFYDPEARVGKVYSGILNLPRGLPAWDVYLVFGPEVRWKEGPPAPAYWMHQLGRAGPPELRLDGEQLARVVCSLLPRSGLKRECRVVGDERLAPLSQLAAVLEASLPVRGPRSWVEGSAATSH